MPPLLALILCTAFVLFMLRLDRKQSVEVSFTVWIPTIWMLLTFSKPLGIWFHSGAVSIEEGSPLDRNFLTVMLCLGLVIIAKRRFKWTKAVQENFWFFALIFYMLLSCLWSEIPFISFKRWSRELVAIVMVFLIASEPDSRKALETIFRRTVYILIPYSYILIHYFPEYGRIYLHHEGILMWTGVAMHKNTLAQLCLFSALFIIWTLVRRSQGKDIPAGRYQTFFDFSILLLAFWLWGGPQHTFTYSATATVAFAIGLLVFIILFWARSWGSVPGKKILTAILAFIVIYGTATPIVGELSILDVSSTLGRNETLTGRTIVWEKLVPVAMKKPILGNGFNSFWGTATREFFQISEAHNGYLELILSIGFVGLFLYAMFLVSSIRKAQMVMTRDFDWGVLWICYLLMGTLINITESSFSSFTSKLMAVILMLNFSSVKTPQKSEPIS